MIKAMLTTVDNPHNPFENFRAWYAWDVSSGHYASHHLANIVSTSYELSEEEQNQANTDAIDEIVKENISGVYKKVTKKFID